VPAEPVRANIDSTYTSSIFLFTDNAAHNTFNGYGLLNARLAWGAPNNRYKIALRRKKLTNPAYVTAIAPVMTQDQINYDETRTYGIQLRAHL
jgi:iron complex outermembrane receptor protein